MTDSRISGLHRLGVRSRLAELERRGLLSAADAELLRQGRHVLTAASADRMIENVIGTFALPLAIAPNLIVNGREHLVPMVVEEPSIVAATSHAALLARSCGGVVAAGSAAGEHANPQSTSDATAVHPHAPPTVATRRIARRY